MKFADHVAKGQQHIFDVVSKHLITQGRRSVAKTKANGGELICSYRGDDGCKCAIGVLIADDEYEPELEGTVIGNCNNQRVSARFRVMLGSVESMLSGRMINLLDGLQAIHDSVNPIDWPEHLIELAKRFELSDGQLKAFIKKMDDEGWNFDSSNADDAPADQLLWVIRLHKDQDLWVSYPNWTTTSIAAAQRYATQTAAKGGLTRFRKSRTNKFDNAIIEQVDFKRV